nr:hypothetical protein [Tanacetum cinerariifolium]GEZ14141.1 hypothetical protein [Tanacetum cinerariifolium]GEZ14147.1 hypothetical protein [Tanacetum cinerariifolium]
MDTNNKIYNHLPCSLSACIPTHIFLSLESSSTVDNHQNLSTLPHKPRTFNKNKILEDDQVAGEEETTTGDEEDGKSFFASVNKIHKQKSRTAIVVFMVLEQLKWLFGIKDLTNKMDIVTIMCDQLGTSWSESPLCFKLFINNF